MTGENGLIVVVNIPLVQFRIYNQLKVHGNFIYIYIGYLRLAVNRRLVCHVVPWLGDSFRDGLRKKELN